MSDFFMSNNSTDEFKKRLSGYTQNVADERLQNRQRYGVELSDKEYAQINNLIADSENQDEEAHKIGSAILFSKKLGIPVDEAYTNLDSYTEALWGTEKSTSYRSAFTAISDMFVIGNNGLKLGNLGNKLKEAEIAGDQEMVDQLYKEIELIEQDNAYRQDNAPRSWVTEALKSGAQTLPFSGEAAALGLFGNFIAPGVGTVLAFGSSSSMASGQEYIDMRREGVTADTARKVAGISGGIQGLIEVALGTTTDYLAAGAGKKMAETAAGQVAKKASEAFAKRFHYGAGKKVAVELVTAWTADKLGEGTEEALQEITSIISNDVARSMDGLGLSDETIADKTKQVVEAFKGGVVGAIVLGLPLDVINTNASIKDYKKLKEAASTISSKEMFEKVAENNPVLNELKDEKKKEVINEIWNNVQNEMEAAELHEARGVAEVNTADESFENIETDEETGETNAAPVARDELTGGLITQSDITEEDGNIKKESYRAGDNTKENKNVYGYINATIDEDNKTVTIDKFSMNSQREGLRQELYDNFARDHAGYKIEWNPQLKIAKDVKERLVAANPSGKNNGLNYYSSQDEIANIKTRKEVASQIREAYKNVGKKLTNEQVAADVSILESLYNRLGRDLKDRGVNNFTDYVSYTFGNKLFGDQKEAFEAAARQGEQGKVQGASVTRNLKEFDRGMKALIYVTQNGDFSTFSHEVAHIARKQLTGSLLDEATKAFGVQQGENGQYNWTQAQEEAFAYGFEQFLRTGQAKNEGLRTLFQKLAQFLNDCMTALKSQINITPEIEKVYNELLAGDKSVLAAAKRAAEQSDMEYRQQQEEEAVQAKEAEYKQQQEERAANMETTDYEDTVEQPDTVTQNVTEDTTETVTTPQQQINDVVDNTSLSLDDRETAKEILNDPEETIGAKEKVIQDVAGEAFNNEAEDVIDPDMFFQTAEEEERVYNKAIKYLDTFEDKKESERIKTNLKELAGTPWYKSTIKALTIREDINAILNGEMVDDDSIVKNVKAYYDVLTDGDTYEERVEHLYEYFDCDSSLVGSPSKCINAVGSSFINCNPSKNCAEFCYAAKGRTGTIDSQIANRELVNWAIEHDPKRAAEIVRDQYVHTREYKNGVALRLLDTGDLSEKWLDFIRYLNAGDELGRDKVECQIFSKRPELLSQIDSRQNVVLLSIDESNEALAAKWPTLPVAYVLANKGNNSFIINNETRFKQYGGSILPVAGNKAATEAAIAAMKELPKWTLNYTCPIDAGWKEIGNNKDRKYDKDKWNCSVCDTNGQGCFFKRAINDRQGFYATLHEMPTGVVNAVYNEFRAVEDKLRKQGFDESAIRSVLEALDSVRNEKLAGIDTEGTRSGSIGYNGSLSETNEKTGSKKSENSSEETELDTPILSFQKVTDPEEIARLEKEPTVKAYRAMQIIDGNLYPPMSAKVDGKLRDPIELGAWEKADENPDMADNNGMFKLNKGNGKTILARYNPYFHSSPTMLNDQFSEAQDRSNLVTVEVEIPVSELNSENPYRAEKAKDTVGTKQWKAGIIQAQLTGTREVNLSRWDKPVRIVPAAEVAQNIKKTFGDKNITMPSNVVPPEVKTELKKLGVQFVTTTNKGILTDGENAGIHYSKVYGTNKNKLLFQTEEEQINSDSFKNWFGDWKNDPANASKVVDNEGKPLVVYHGTNAYIPDIKKFKKGTKGYLGPGMYFTNSIDYARRYTDYGDEGLIRLFLNIRNPLTVSTNNPAMEILQAIYGDGAEKIYKKRELKDDRITNIITKADTEKLKAAGYDGIIWNLTGDVEYLTFEQNQIKSSEANNGEFDPSNPNIYFQTAYHGSAADFDKFDTEHYGLSGEGSMSFGYGTYVAGNEEIARDYAIRQYNSKFETEVKESRLANLNERIADDERKLKTLESPEAYFAERDREIESLTKEIEADEAAGDPKEWKKNLLKGISKQYTEENRVSYLKAIKASVESDKKEIAEIEKALEYINANKDNASRKLYTVDIPDKGFIKWDKTVPKATRARIVDNLYRKLIKEDYAGAERELRYELSPLVETALTGQDIYQDVWTYLGSDKEASKFLYDMGFSGIDYPAGTNYGTEIENARNYVIFNDDDAKIIDKLSFQTQQELYNDARSFESWTDFMDAYQTDFDPAAFEDPMYHSQVPSGASAQWYQTTWELANGIQPEESMNEQEVQDKYAKEGTEPRALDSIFAAELTSNPNMFDDFMHMVAYYDNLDLDKEYGQVADEEEARERDHVDQIKTLIDRTFNTEGTTRALNRIAAGGELTPDFRKRLITEIGNAAREYRALYAEIMQDPTYRVNEEDTVENMNKQKVESLNKRYNLQLPEVDQSRMTPRQRIEYGNNLENEEIAQQLKDGTLKMDDQVDKYINSLKAQIAEQKKMYKELQSKILEETARIADEEQQDLLKLNEKLNALKLAVDKRDNEMMKKLSQGLKISAKYQKESQNLKHDYNEIMRKYKDALATTKITGEVQRALDMQEKLSGALSQINKLEDERITMGDVQKLRKNLVKRTMRRVKFDTVDYDNARQIIAIQRIFEPNLLGGVNKWIGQRDPYLRGVISAVITDKDYRNDLTNHIRERATSSNAYSEFYATWQDLITTNNVDEAMKKFNSWDDKTRKRAIMYLPKEDWIKELQLKELEKEREESIDLDIGIKERRVPMRDEKGELIYKPQYDENGKPIKNPEKQEYYMKTMYEFDASEEIKTMIRDAVGEDIFNNLLYRPFSEWTVEEMEKLAKRVDDLYTEGRDILAAKKQLQLEKAAAIRQQIEKAVKDTGIVINDDDTPEEKAKKQAKIDKILGLSDELKGTNASKDTGFKSRINRLLHGYVDANVLRVARILDGNTEGVNVNELYRKEDECYNAKTRSINNRVAKINQVMTENNITLDELASTVKVGNATFSIDEMLFIAAANEDYVEDPAKLAKGETGIAANDDWAATSRNAVMFGNLFSDTASTEFKEECVAMDEEMQRRIDADELTAVERNAQILGELVNKPGTARYISQCHAVMEQILTEVNNLDDKYKALLKVIADDYAEQYDRMNEISIREFNTPVHRVKCYVPLVRLESNGDTNVNQVKEDLLAALGQGAGKQWVNKGMTQRRTSMNPLHQKPVQMGLYKTWADSNERTEHFIAYSGYVRELNRVYKSRDAQYTRQFIENRYGKGMLSYLDDYINEVANPNANKIREKGAELLHTLRGKTAPAYLAWKASAIIKQGLTSPWPYMQFINPAEYAAASWKCITSKGAMYDAIRQKSVFMNNRVMDPMNDLIDEMAEKANQNKFDKALNKFNKKGMAGLEWIDWVCVAPGWYACYEKKYNELVGKNQEVYEATKERLKEENYYAEVGTPAWKTSEQIEKLAQKAMDEDVEKRAVQYADDCTRACQPSNRSADISPLFKNSSEAMKAYLQFQTSLNVIWQNIRYDIPYAIKKNEFNRVAMTIVGYALAGIFMNSVMDGLGGDDDDDGSKIDDRIKKQIFYATTQFTDAVPMVGSELTNTMDQLITGKRQFMNSGTDMTPTLTKMLSILTNAKKGNWEKAAEMTAEGFAMYLGLPVSGGKEIKKLAGVGDGDGKAGLNLGNVYGILDTEDYK